MINEIPLRSEWASEVAVVLGRSSWGWAARRRGRSVRPPTRQSRRRASSGSDSRDPRATSRSDRARAAMPSVSTGARKQRRTRRSATSGRLRRTRRSRASSCRRRAGGRSSRRSPGSAAVGMRDAIEVDDLARRCRRSRREVLRGAHRLDHHDRGRDDGRVGARRTAARPNGGAVLRPSLVDVEFRSYIRRCSSASTGPRCVGDRVADSPAGSTRRSPA